MKPIKFAAIILTLIMAIALAACNAPAAETEFTRAEDNTAEKVVADTTAAADTAVADEVVAEFSAETTSTAETTTATTKQQSAICGLYRAVIPEHEGGDDYDYMRIDEFDDGSFQVEIMPVAGGTGNDYVVYETEELGTGSIQSFTFDPDIAPIPRSVTITADGNTAWVTYEGGEPLEYVKEAE
jgi:hypothetical protein